jgi:hypothetical protein
MVKRKLLSTYQYSKHKRGKNPFKMLLSNANPSKKEDSETMVDKILIKNVKKNRPSTFHYMTPIKNFARKEKSSKNLEVNSNEISTALPNTDEKTEEKLQKEMNEKKHLRAKSSISPQRINDKIKNIEKTNFYKSVNSAIIKKCNRMFQEGDYLKGYFLKQFHNFFIIYI